MQQFLGPNALVKFEIFKKAFIYGSFDVVLKIKRIVPFSDLFSVTFTKN